MSNDNKGAGDTQVSGAEQVYTKQGKINKGIKTSTYGETKTSAAKDKSDFHTAGQKDEIKSGHWAIDLVGNATLGWTNAGSKKTREFFTDKVLTSKGVTHKGTHYGKESFNQLSAEEKEEIYGGYMDDRMSGKTDAYGNPNPGYNKGGNGNNQTRKTEVQIITENKAIEDEEIATKISEEEYKKRRGLKGSRSMFANSGGRGFYDPV